MNGTELSAVEFRDALHMRYARTPLGLQPNCEGCGQQLIVWHALACKKFGLVHSRNNAIRDELVDLESKAFSPSAVRNKPKISIGRAPKEKTPELQEAPTVKKLLSDHPSDERGDVLIRGLWEQGTDYIIDVCLTDVDAKSCRSKTPEKVLAAQDWEKKGIYLEAYIQ